MALSRRHLFKSGLTFAGTIGLGSVATRSLAADAPSPTVSKQNAGYQDQPKGEQHCGICNHFVAPGSCNVVMGTVAPNGWCKLFAPKSS
ncbi:MAG TPA: hypothetical protein VGI20_14285 [Rhizomicrobium sp.]|jgi:hypothetical protein